MESQKLRTTLVLLFLVLSIALSTPSHTNINGESDRLKSVILEKTQDFLNLSASLPVDLSKRFLSIFNEIENGIEQVLQKAEEGTKMIEQSRMASEASLKLRKSVQDALTEATGGRLDGLEESIVSNVFGLIAATTVAASAYAYMI